MKRFARTLAAAALGTLRVLIDPEYHVSAAARERRLSLQALCRDPLFVTKLDWFHGDVSSEERVKTWRETLAAWDREGWSKKYAPELPRGPFTIGDLLQLGYQLNHEQMDEQRHSNETRPRRFLASPR